MKKYYHVITERNDEYISTVAIAENIETVKTHFAGQNGRKYRYTLEYNPLSAVHTWIVRQPFSGCAWEWVQPLPLNLCFTPRGAVR